MKDFREETYKKKNADLQKRLKKKDQNAEFQLKNQREIKDLEKNKRIEEMMNREKEAKENVERFQEYLEKQRLELEEKTFQKSK